MKHSFKFFRMNVYPSLKVFECSFNLAKYLVHTSTLFEINNVPFLWRSLQLLLLTCFFLQGVNVSGLVTTAKKSWNTGIITSCQYLQENCDVKVLGRVVSSKSKDAYNSLIGTTSTPEESHDESNSSTDSPSEDNS